MMAQEGRGGAVEVLGFGNKCNDICVMVIVSGMVFVSSFMG